MRVIALLLSSVTIVTSYVIFDAQRPISTDAVDIRVIDREKRASVYEMPFSYDLLLNIEGDNIRIKLTKNEAHPAFHPHSTDWAGYMSDEVSGIFIVRHPQHKTDVSIEGFMVCNGSTYLIQPRNGTGSHVIHKLHDAVPTPDLTASSEPDWRNLVKSRSKRDNNLWLRSILTIKWRLEFDKQAVRHTQARLDAVKPGLNAEKFLKEYAVMITMFAEKAIANLRDLAPFRVNVTRFVIHQNDVPSVARLPHVMSARRMKTTCAVRTSEKLREFYRNELTATEHFTVITGYDLLSKDGNNSITTYAIPGTVCTRDSLSIAEVMFNMDGLKRFIQTVMISIGIMYDGGPDPRSVRCPPSGNFVMSPNVASPYSVGANAYKFSSCSKVWLREAIRALPTEISNRCFRRVLTTSLLSKGTNYGVLFSLSDQCRLTVGKRSLPDRLQATDICADGIKCGENARDFVRIIPQEGTLCRSVDHVSGYFGAPVEDVLKEFSCVSCKHETVMEQKTLDAKVVVLGAQGVGKTSLVIRLVGNMFSDAVSPTIGASFFTYKMMLGGYRIRLQVWDTAGQERFRAMVMQQGNLAAPMYYRNANAALIVYDITCMDSYYDMKSWIKELKKNVETPIVMCIIGNKCDLHANRKVTTTEVSDFAYNLNARFYETSALQNTGVDEVFLELGKQLVSMYEANPHCGLAPHGLYLEPSLPFRPDDTFNHESRTSLSNNSPGKSHPSCSC